MASRAETCITAATSNVVMSLHYDGTRGRRQVERGPRRRVIRPHSSIWMNVPWAVRRRPPSQSENGKSAMTVRKAAPARDSGARISDSIPNVPLMGRAADPPGSPSTAGIGGRGRAKWRRFDDRLRKIRDAAPGLPAG